MVRIIDLSISRKILNMKILSDDEEDLNPGMIFTFQRFDDEYFKAKAPSKVDLPHLMDWTIEHTYEFQLSHERIRIGGKAKWSKAFPQDEMSNLRLMPKFLKSSKPSRLKNSKVEKLGFNDVICDDRPYALPFDNISSILGPASYDLPLITSKDLDGNPSLKESSTSHYEAKQQDAHQIKKASRNATYEVSAFCDNDFMTDYRRKVSVMAWKGPRAKIGRTSTS
ncbi:hypothetical protein JCGZ_05221 [Jatropha curcas]|uniref:Uncharacterized protein n=1 Tax=Jatropha curcas TaxID=180498 RepID=A0A067KNF8_JATCU|nr:hypothetical protein JCGZ_05221 [Jatropha curcas]